MQQFEVPLCALYVLCVVFQALYAPLYALHVRHCMRVVRTIACVFYCELLKGCYSPSYEVYVQLHALYALP